MVGRALQAEGAAGEDSPSSAANAEADLCLLKKDYFAFPFRLLLHKLLSATAASDAADGAASRDVACCGGPAGGLIAAEKVLLLLPVCARCSALSSCELDDSRCIDSSRSINGSNGSGKVTDLARGAEEGVSAPCCVCSKCTSSLLLQLLLRVGLHKLRGCGSTGVLFCGSDDVPETQKDFFLQLLRPHEEQRWWLRGSRTHAQRSTSQVNLSSHEKDYLLLRRVGYKLLPGPQSSRLPPHQTTSVHAPSSCEPPLLLRYLTELPEALQKRPPGLLLFLQPSRWLTPAGQRNCAEATTLQQLTDRKSYGFFLALLCRAAGRGPTRSFPSSTLGRVEGGLRADEEELIQAPEPCVVTVAECFLACSKCCWRCSGGVEVTREGSVSLCCLEQSEWLCMLRSRFTRILLVVCASADPNSCREEAAHASSALVREAQGETIFVADVTDVALP
ncbi:hypothetical protein Emag_001919 [Eimeria magna]